MEQCDFAVLAVLSCMLVWYYWPEGQTEKVQTAAKAEAKKWTGKLRLPFQKDKTLPAQFRRWVSEANLVKQTSVYKKLPEDAAEFTFWIEGLSDKELAEFTKEQAALCQGLGYELTWLLDPKIPAALKSGLEEAVVLSSLTAWKARNLQPLAAYIRWQAAPEKAENREFTRKLYARLAEAGLTQPASGMLMAPEKEQQAYVAKAIETVAAENQAAFLALVKEIMEDQAADSRPASSPEQPLASSEPNQLQAAEVTT